MVRWKNRTPEDKERILKEQRALQTKVNKPNFNFNIIKETENNVMEIYKRGAIPILCLEHGWVESEKYELGLMKHIFTGNQIIDSIKGNCPKCRKDIVRAFPTGNESLLFPLAIVTLRKQGRLEDKR